jgi:hypothetical protein
MRIRQKALLLCGFLVAGVIVGGLSLLFDLGGTETDALIGVALALLALLGIPYAFDAGHPAGRGKKPQDFGVMKSHKTTVGAEDGADEVSGSDTEFEVRQHTGQPYRIAHNPVVVSARGATSARPAFRQSFYKPPSTLVA